MFFRKAVAGIAAVTIVASSAGMTAFAADTDAAREQSFAEAKMPVVLYSPDQVTEIDCRFFENTPSIPYVRFSDYYECWSGEKVGRVSVSKPSTVWRFRYLMAWANVSSSAFTTTISPGNEASSRAAI